jgi:hypothetical protein
MIELVLLIAALVLFLLATLGAPDSERFHLVPAGLACATLAVLLPLIR